MADFDIRDIAALKVKLQIIEKLVLADWILIILSMYYDWGGWITCLIVIQIILYIYKSKLRKQLKQKEYRQSGRRANNRTPYPARPSAE